MTIPIPIKNRMSPNSLFISILSFCGIIISYAVPLILVSITPVLPLVLVSITPVLPDLWKQLYPVQSGLQNPEPYQAPWSARPDS